MIADLSRKRDEQVGAAIDEDGDVAVVVTELQGGFGHGFDPLGSWPSQQTPQMDADNLAPIPGAGERVVGRRSPLCRGRDGGGDARRVERASFERAFGRLGADRRRRHRAKRDARADDAAAGRSEDALRA